VADYEAVPKGCKAESRSYQLCVADLPASGWECNNQGKPVVPQLILDGQPPCFSPYVELSACLSGGNIH
jgi:hypothetical protein